MADIAAFRGIRYDLKKVPSLTSVVAPPYDVINEAYRQRLAAREAHNCVHLILPQDSPAGDRYATAAAALKRWLAEGVLVEEKAPAIYVISQEWTHAGRRNVRTGFIAAVRLEPFGEGRIYPHENTLSAPKADRLNLIKATRANLSQVFGIFPDDQRDVEAWLGQVTARAADAETTDDGGVTTRLWLQTDPKRIATLTRAMAGRPMFIADGHHRYETALNYRRFADEASLSLNAAKTTADAPFLSKKSAEMSKIRPIDAIMMFCVAMSDPGLITQPTHRLLPKSITEPAKLLEKLGREFHVLPFATVSGGAGAVDEELKSDATPNLMALYVGKERPLMKVWPKDPSAILRDHASFSADWRTLDVSILQYAVLERLLGLTLEHVTRDAKIGYEHDSDEAMRRVDSGEFASAFILRPTPVDAVARVASHLEKMPPKSTFFYPKALTGIVMRGLW